MFQLPFRYLLKGAKKKVSCLKSEIIVTDLHSSADTAFIYKKIPKMHKLHQKNGDPARKRLYSLFMKKTFIVEKNHHNAWKKHVYAKPLT